ncbi:MAG TPA: hypothetical protein VGZ73_26030 [Bryobacteraceae bacterium]|jgi:hypothetical protein|nr:hypothetical protein [Bryobacteraceae bacterium]
MDDKVRTALRDLVAAQGEELLASRGRLRGMLLDDCPESTKEINALMIAVQAQVPSELRAYSSAGDTRIAVNAGILRLERAFGLGRPAAAWAVLSLAYAVGRIPDEQFPGLLAELSAGAAAPAPDRPESEPPRPLPTPTPAPRSPPPRPVSQSASYPISTVSPPGPPAYPNTDPSVLASRPETPVVNPPAPLPPPRAETNLRGLATVGAVLFAVIVLYSLTHHSPPEQKSSLPPESQPSRSEPSPAQPSQSQPPAPEPVPQPAAFPGGFTTYADASSLFQMNVPAEWVLRRAETDTTLDNMPCHLVHAAVFARQAERSDLDGWVSEGIRVSVYLPAKGQIWPTDWAADWQRKAIADSLAGYSKYQNTAVEPVQLGNIQATTTAVMGEAKAISEPEVARIYVGVSQKFLVTVEVSMPSSKRPLFESADETVRRTFAINVP